MLKWGINENLRALNAQPQHPQDLAGLQYVRAVLIGEELGQSLDQALDFYQPFVAQYAQLGIRTILIINHQSIVGNRPWDNGDYASYAPLFAAGCKKIAQRLKGLKPVYEIWNEGDLPGNPASKFIPADSYAPILSQAAAAIRAVDSDASVILGGLASATSDAIAYVREVRNKLGGVLPVDAIGLHPYGKWPPNFSGRPAWGSWFSPLQPDLASFVAAFPTIPVWITEIGISEDVVIPTAFYSMVVNFMSGINDLINGQLAPHIPVVVWFAWSDQMRNAGIVDTQNVPKQPIYDKFFALARKASNPMSSNLTFQADITIPDHSPIAPGTTFLKTWRVLNSGDVDWNHCVLAFASGEKMGAGQRAAACYAGWRLGAGFRDVGRPRRARHLQKRVAGPGRSRESFR